MYIYIYIQLYIYTYVAWSNHTILTMAHQFFRSASCPLSAGGFQSEGFGGAAGGLCSPVQELSVKSGGAHGVCLKMGYPLVMTNSLPWYRWPIYRWFIYQKWWFSIAMLNNQRVHCINWLSVQVCYPHLYSILGISFSHVSMACIDWFPIHKHHISAQPKISFSDVWPPNSKVISGT